MLNVDDLLPPGGPVQKELLRRHLVGPVANVQGFGAKGNGIADDTGAIQAAIDFVVSQGGGTVYIPAGIYKIMPQREATGGLEINALTIRGDNVHIAGDGPETTRLMFRTADDRDPSNSYDVIKSDGQSLVWRGSAIAIEGTDNTEQPRRDIIIEGLEIDGGAYPGNTGDRTWPAPTDTGAGWDITHKGILIVPDRVYRGLSFVNLHLHNFRGEIIYGGGRWIDNVIVDNCRLHSTNGDAISISASMVVRNNQLYDCAHACVENPQGPKEARYINNRFSNASYGVGFATDWDSPFPALICGNVFEECTQAGITFISENGPTLITDNVFIDCGYLNTSDATIQISPGKGMTAPTITGVVIRNNVILRQHRSGGFGIYLGCDDRRKLQSILVSDNFIGSSGPAIEKNFRFLAPIAYAFIGKAETDGVFISGNTFFKTQRSVQNPIGSRSSVSMPLMRGNRTLDTQDQANSFIVTDGKAAIRLQNEGPTVLSGSVDGKIVVPVLVPRDYMPGQKLTITGDSATRRIYIPQSSNIYECCEGRFLSAGVFLTFECDGKKFFEVEYVDQRPHHYAEVVDGSVIDADGHSTVYLSMPSEHRFTAFEGIGHGAQVRLIATTNNVTIAHSDSIQLSAGTDYQMMANEVKLFFRGRDGVLREI
jgi:hypothetical protein